MVSAATCVSDVLSRLNFRDATDFATPAQWVTEAELYQFADDAAQKLAYLTGIYTTIDTTSVEIAGGVYQLPASHVFTLAAWIGGASFTLFGSQPGVGKALATSSAPPAGWQNAGFDDSAWFAPTLQAAPLGPPYSGSNWISPQGEATATLRARTAYNPWDAPSGTNHGYERIDIIRASDRAIVANVLLGAAGHSAATYSLDLSTLSVDWHGLLDGSLYVQFWTWTTLWMTDTPYDQIIVYDCWIDLAYTDGSTAVARPTVATAVAPDPATVFGTSVGSATFTLSLGVVSGDIRRTMYTPFQDVPPCGRASTFAIATTSLSPSSKGLYRYPFTLDSVTGDLTLKIQADNELHGIYINGHALTWTSTGPPEWDQATITLVAANLLAGANLLSVLVQPQASPPAGSSIGLDFVVLGAASSLHDLRITPVRELEFLDNTWPATTGTPTRCSHDANAVGTLTVYPRPPHDTVTLVLQEFPAAISLAQPSLNVPSVMQDWLAYSMLEGARRKESDGRDEAMAEHYAQRCRLYEAIAAHLWGTGQ